MHAPLEVILDQYEGQKKRDLAYGIASEVNRIRGPVVVYGAPERVISAAGGGDAISAVIPFKNKTFDEAFVKKALAADHRIVMPDNMLALLDSGFEVLAPPPEDVPDRYSEVVLAQ